MASLALLLQVACIYWFTAILKYGNEWTRDGTALYYVFSADQFVRGLGRWLLGWPDVCRWLTLGTWWLEMLGPFIAFIPMRTPWWRLVVVAAMMSLHLGIALCMSLGMFPWVMMLAWVPFLPSMFWDRLAVLGASPSRSAWVERLSRDHAVEICCGWLRPTTAASGSAVWAIEWWKLSNVTRAASPFRCRPPRKCYPPAGEIIASRGVMSASYDPTRPSLSPRQQPAFARAKRCSRWQ